MAWSLRGFFFCFVAGRVFAEHGAKAFYFNFQHRMAIIALWTSILNVAQPFEKQRLVDL